MSVQGLAHVNLRAPRALLDELLRFYTEVLGLSAGPRPAFRRPGHWLYAQGRDVLHLTEAAADEERAVGVATTLDHFALACAKRAQMEARLREFGVSYRTSGVPGTGVVQLFLHDPAGNGVELNFDETPGSGPA